MRLNIRQTRNNCRILWTDGEVFYVSSGMHFWGMGGDGQRRGEEAIVGNALERVLSSQRLIRQFLRLGVHHLWPMPNGEFLVVVRKRVFTVDPVSKNVRQVFRFPRGNKPAHRGVCVTESGTIFMGEYVINLDRRHPISLYRSRDFGQSFTIVLAFEPGEVRHIHFVQWDRFAQCLWLGTGDADSECRLYRSDNQGDSWELVGGGNQLWRTVGIAFQEKAIYWGTDAGSDTGSHPNHVIRFDRITGELSKLEKLQGPCHGTASLKDGTIVVSTGVEGGQNEIDDRAHLWCSSDGKNWSEALSFRKDHFPYLMQYGVLRFPQGLDSCATLAFTGMGLVGAGEKAFWAELV